MSYLKVKSIQLDEKDKKVYINGASNNIRPIEYSTEEAPTLSRIFSEHGEESLIKEVLNLYYTGEFQPGISNDYYKSLSLLNREKYNWDNGYNKLYTEEELKNHLYENYLKLKSEPCGKFIIKFSSGAYVSLFSRHKIFINYNRNLAKVFTKKSQAEFAAHNYNNAIVEEL